MLIDTHAHLTDQRILPHLGPIIERAEQARIKNILNICTDVDTLHEGVALHNRIPWIYNAAATPPHDVATQGDSAFSLIAEAAKKGYLKAIGETGLDYYYEHSPRELQQHFLKRYLLLAEECNLPIVFHCRNAFSDLFSIAQVPRAILHCFTGSLEEAFQAIDRGWLISFSGILTFKKSEELRTVARLIPLEQIVLETDAPYLAPQSKRGQMNEPSFLLETARCLAELKNLSFTEICRVTTENALRFLDIPLC